MILFTNIDRTLVNPLHGLLNCGIGGLNWPVITTEYRTRVHWTPVWLNTDVLICTTTVSCCVVDPFCLHLHGPDDEIIV